MENIEQIKNPEIDIEELKSTISKIKWEDHYQFSYNGSNFLLILVEEDPENNVSDGAEYSRSTAISGWDIYIQKSLSGAERDRRLFHEILECRLLDQGISRENVHNISLEKEEEEFGLREKDEELEN